MLVYVRLNEDYASSVIGTACKVKCRNITGLGLEFGGREQVLLWHRVKTNCEPAQVGAATPPIVWPRQTN